MKSVYELKRFKTSNDKHLTHALFIYSQNIEPLLRTDTREIIYWLDNYSKKFKDQFLVFGLFLNDQLIGFAQLAYFSDEKLIFVDYIVIQKEFRKNNTFYEFVEEIREYLITEKLQFDYILAEVGSFDENKEPTSTTKNLIRLLKMTGFGVTKANYYHPRLGKNNFESEIRSVLMLYSPNELKSIKRETYFLILDTIYFKHYKRWYDYFFNEKEKAEYANSLIMNIKKNKDELKKKTTIEINGYPNIFTTSHTIEIHKPYQKLAKVIAMGIVFLILIFVFGFVYRIVKTKYDIDITAQTYIVGASGFCILFFLILFKERKTNSLTTIVERFFDKIKK